MAFIYLITNAVNGRRYVGKTAKPHLSLRWNEHRCYAKRGSSQLIHKAMRKYGFASFKLALVAVVPEGTNAGQWERWTIAALRTEVPNGYNLTAGGEGVPGFKHTVEARAKMRTAKLGTKQTPEHVAKRFAWRKPGHRHSEETCKKLKEAAQCPNHHKWTSETAKAARRCVRLPKF